MITKHFPLKCLMLGVILSTFAFAGTADAATLSTLTPGPGFSVTTTATFNNDSTGKCPAGPGPATCNVGVTAQADGPGPYRYDWWGDTPSGPPEYLDQQNAGFWYGDAGTFYPTVKVTNTNTGQSVYASPGAIWVYRILPPPVELLIVSPRRGTELFLVTYSRTPLRVFWKSGNTVGKVYVTKCFRPEVGYQCNRILAAPKGPMRITASVGSGPGETVSKTITYTGPPVGSFKARYRSKKSGSRCRVTAWVTGAAGVKYKYRPTVNGKKGKAKRGRAGGEPIKTLGKVVRTFAKGQTIRIRHRLTVGRKAYGPKKTKKPIWC